MEEGCSSSYIQSARFDGYVPCSPSSSGINPVSPRKVERDRFGWMANVWEDLNITEGNEEMAKIHELQDKSSTHRKNRQRTNWLYFWSGGYDIWLLKSTHRFKLEKYVKNHKIYESKFCIDEEKQNNDNEDTQNEDKLKEQMEEYLTKSLIDINLEEQRIEEQKERFNGRIKFLFSIWEETEFFSPFETIESSSERLVNCIGDTYIIRLSTTAVGNITITKRTQTSITHRRLPIVGHSIYDSEYRSVIKNQSTNMGAASCVSSYYPSNILNYVQF